MGVIWCIHSRALDWNAVMDYWNGILEWSKKFECFVPCFSLLNKQDIGFSSTSWWNYSTVYSDHPLAMSYGSLADKVDVCG